MRTATLLLPCILSFSIAHSALAGDKIRIEPGMWEFSSTMKSSMFPQVRTQTETQCIKLAEIGPDDLIPEEGGGDCTMTDTQASGNSISWKMQCNTPGGAMHGHGQFKSNGNSGSGSMQMNMSIEGHSMTMDMAWEGKRTGSC